jgi:hypothetical protein
MEIKRFDISSNKSELHYINISIILTLGNKNEDFKIFYTKRVPMQMR